MLGLRSNDAEHTCLSVFGADDDDKASSRRALYAYFRGRTLDTLPDYSKEAEEHLSRAVRYCKPGLGFCFINFMEERVQGNDQDFCCVRANSASWGFCWNAEFKEQKG